MALTYRIRPVESRGMVCPGIVVPAKAFETGAVLYSEKISNTDGFVQTAGKAKALARFGIISQGC